MGTASVGCGAERTGDAPPAVRAGQGVPAPPNGDRSWTRGSVWRKLRNAGPKFLAAVRAAAAGITAAAVITHPSDPGTVEDRRRHLDERLEQAKQLRYRVFATALAASRLPLAALDAIVDALNAEPLPPADASVAVLLETGEEPALLDLYRRTHAQ